MGLSQVAPLLFLVSKVSRPAGGPFPLATRRLAHSLEPTLSALARQRAWTQDRADLCGGAQGVFLLGALEFYIFIDG